MCRLTLIGLQNRLCGPLLCSKNSTFLHMICILDPFGPSHGVEGHFKLPLCRCSVPFEKCYIFPTKNRFLPRKTEVRSRSGCTALSLLGSKIAFVGHCCVQKIAHFFTEFAFWTHLGHPMRSKAASSNVVACFLSHAKNATCFQR